MKSFDKAFIRISKFIFLAFLSTLISPINTAISKMHPMYEFGKDYLPLNEKIDYVISSFERETDGKGVFTIKKITQLDMDMFLIRYEGDEGERKENWEIKLLMEDLKPFSFELTVEEPETTQNFTGTVNGREIVVNVRATDQEPEEKLWTRDSKFYISMMLPYLLRNLDFVKDDYFTFNLLQVDTGRFTTPIIQVKDKEVVEVPAGLYECWKVSIKLGTEQHFAWYSIKDPHYLVKYKYPNKEFAMKRHY